VGIMSRPPRLAGFDYHGRYSYFLTFCTHRRQPIFFDSTHAAVVQQQILRASARFEFALFAYCVMPDHVHLLVHGASPRSDLRRFIKRVKQSTGQTYNSRMNGPLWQEGYYDRVVRPEEDLSGIARYIIENPVRARLVHHPHDYPFVGSSVWSLEDILRRGF
jgi:putative transposase